MPSYIRVLRNGSQNVRLLLPDGTTQLVSYVDMVNWECVDSNIQPDLTPMQRSPRGFRTPRATFVNPENQSDRIYERVFRHGPNRTCLELADGSRISVPNQYLDTWFQRDSYQYVEWNESTNYPNGRQLSDLTFGVELEFVADPSRYDDFINAMVTEFGNDRFMAPMCYGRSSSTKWSLQTDSSVRSTSSRGNQRGYELTSPILKFDNSSKEELMKVLHIITSVFNGVVNRTCGTHIHVGNFTRIVNNYGFREKALNFQRNYGAFEEKVFDRLVSPSRKGNNNHYCKTCKDSDLSDRYHKINTQNLFGFGTLENRQHQGTLEIKKIWSWMELNGRYMAKYFHDPLLFSDTSLNLEQFMSMIGLSEDTQAFFLARESELN